MVGAILSIIGAVLSIVETKNRRKYLDEHKRLSDAWWVEWSRNEAERSDAVLDNLEREIKQLAKMVEQDLRLMGGK